MTEALFSVDEIIPYDTLDEGVPFRFRGIQTDDEGEPLDGASMIEVELVIPPLNLQNVKRVQKYFTQVEGTLNAETLAAMASILAPAIAQNYKGVPRWLIEQSINVANLTDVFQAVMDVNGFKRKAVAEEKKAMAAVKPPDATSTALSPTSV